MSDAKTWIENAQREAGREAAGAVFTHGVDELGTALEESWLVVEVGLYYYPGPGGEICADNVVVRAGEN